MENRPPPVQQPIFQDQVKAPESPFFPTAPILGDHPPHHLSLPPLAIQKKPGVNLKMDKSHHTSPPLFQDESTTSSSSSLHHEEEASQYFSQPIHGSSLVQPPHLMQQEQSVQSIASSAGSDLAGSVTRDSLVQSLSLAQATQATQSAGASSQSQTKSSTTISRKKALKRAPGAPKRSKSSYILFSMDKRPEIKAQLGPKTNVTDIMKAIARLWSTLTEEEKEPWKEAAEFDKHRYINEMASYDGPLKVPNRREKRHPMAPKRATSGFLFFSQATRSTIRAAHPNMKNTDISKHLGSMWRNMTVEDKSSFLKLEKEDRARYQEEIKSWTAPPPVIDGLALAPSVNSGSFGSAAPEQETSTTSYHSSSNTHPRHIHPHPVTSSHVSAADAAAAADRQQHIHHPSQPIPASAEFSSPLIHNLVSHPPSSSGASEGPYQQNSNSNHSQQHTYHPSSHPPPHIHSVPTPHHQHSHQHIPQRPSHSSLMFEKPFIQEQIEAENDITASVVFSDAYPGEYL